MISLKNSTSLVATASNAGLTLLIKLPVNYFEAELLDLTFTYVRFECTPKQKKQSSDIWMRKYLKKNDIYSNLK